MPPVHIGGIVLDFCHCVKTKKKLNTAFHFKSYQFPAGHIHTVVIKGMPQKNRFDEELWINKGADSPLPVKVRTARRYITFG